MPGGGGGGGGYVGQAYKRVLIYVLLNFMHSTKFLTHSFLSAIIMAGALDRARAAPAAPCGSCMHFLHST